MDTILFGAKILLDRQLVRGMALHLRAGRIEAITPEDEIPAGAALQRLDGGIVAPGFIDVQVNGGGGVLFNQTPTVDNLRIIGKAHRKHGTTGFLPTVITDRIDTIERAIIAVEQALDEGVPGVLGIHIEGPMIAAGRHGIHDPALLSNATADLIELICAPRAGKTLVTLAPEIVGSEVIKQLVAASVILAAGHTNATYDQMVEGFAAGVSGVTHLFNAMSPLTSRSPGAVGAALDDQQAWCGFIADGVHVHPASLRIAIRSRPHDRCMLVTDAMPPVGTDANHFELQGRRMTVEDNRCTDEAGRLAGSVLTMEQAVRNLVAFADLTPSIALGFASRSPAQFLGVLGERGEIAVGKAADLVWLDDQLHVRSTWIAGQEWKGYGE